MQIGIDASNIRAGGGLTHLVQLLRAAEPEVAGISRIRVWGGRATLDHLPWRPWLEPISDPALDRSLPHRLLWQSRDLPRLAVSCDLLFAPGGIAPHRFAPVVTMSQNLLPFEWPELRRYGASRVGARLVLLRLAQARAFRRSSAVVFLSRYAETVVRRAVPIAGVTRVIPHGIDSAFMNAPRPQRKLSDCSPEHPMRLLYVSIVDLYKHQWHVARAVAELRSRGLPLSCTFLGPAYAPALHRLQGVLRELDPGETFLRYVGPVAYSDLPACYFAADIAVFASSCENMPNILLEAMGAGMPIACSDRGPMPEALGHAGAYFDPESPESIGAALWRLATDHASRAHCAAAAHARAVGYTWERCARDTMLLLAGVARRRQHSC